MLPCDDDVIDNDGDGDENVFRSCFISYLCCSCHHYHVICISKLSIKFSKPHTDCVPESRGVFGFHILPTRLFNRLDIMALT